MPRIAFDLDDVLVDHTEQFVLWHNLTYKKKRKLRYEDFRLYDLGQILHISSEEAYGRLLRFFDSEEFTAITPLPGAQESVKKVVELGHEALVLTGRPTALRERTKSCIKRYFPQVSSVLFAGELLPGPEKLKGKICQKRGIDLIIEDSFEQALDCAHYAGVLLFNRPWNQRDSIQLPQNVIRVTSWDEVKEVVNTY